MVPPFLRVTPGLPHSRFNAAPHEQTLAEMGWTCFTDPQGLVRLWRFTLTPFRLRPSA